MGFPYDSILVGSARTGIMHAAGHVEFDTRLCISLAPDSSSSSFLPSPPLGGGPIASYRKSVTRLFRLQHPQRKRPPSRLFFVCVELGGDPDRFQIKRKTSPLPAVPVACLMHRLPSDKSRLDGLCVGKE